MKNLGLPESLSDKIFEIKIDDKNKISKLISYFPLSDKEKNEVQNLLGERFHGKFDSIFSDNISDEDWEKSKKQIKKRFQDELFDIDKF